MLLQNINDEATWKNQTNKPRKNINDMFIFTNNSIRLSKPAAGTNHQEFTSPIKDV